MNVLAFTRYACVDYATMQGAFDAVDKMTDNAEIDGQQLVIHSFMPKPDECIPADESTEIDTVIDGVTGKLSLYHSAALRSFRSLFMHMHNKREFLIEITKVLNLFYQRLDRLPVLRTTSKPIQK